MHAEELEVAANTGDVYNPKVEGVGSELIRYISMSAMQEYANVSIEELRLSDMRGSQTSSQRCREQWEELEKCVSEAQRVMRSASSDESDNAELAALVKAGQDRIPELQREEQRLRRQEEEVSAKADRKQTHAHLCFACNAACLHVSASCVACLEFFCLPTCSQSLRAYLIGSTTMRIVSLTNEWTTQ